jgi:hypothetical protein
MSTNNYDEYFLKQIYDSQVKLESALESMLQIIFNLYDDDGDGILSYEEYISFISDLLIISTYMDRLDTNEYNYENVLRVSRWSSSNFTSNLFREPQQKITYEMFLQGIMHAVSEHKNMPILGRKMYLSSLMPEIMNFFHFYDKVAKRRGWPTTIINNDHNIFDASNSSVQSLQEIQDINIEQQQQQQQQQPQQVIPVIPQPSQEEQLREYQARRNQEFRQQQENRQREQQRIQLEVLQQRQQQFQEQFRQNIESRQQSQIQQQQQLIESMNQGVDQFIDEEEHEIPEREIPEQYRLENIGILDINKDETGFDPIEGEVKLLDFIEMDKKNNIVFKFGDRFYLVDKSRLHDMCSLGRKDNSIFYGCMCEIENDWTNPQTWNLLNYVVILDPIYFNMQHLGLPIRYVNLDNIRGLLQPSLTHSYYVIEKPKDYVIIPSFASDNILKHGVGSMSGIHCQTGQEDTIYVIKKFTPNFI